MADPDRGTCVVAPAPDRAPHMLRFVVALLVALRLVHAPPEERRPGSGPTTAAARSEADLERAQRPRDLGRSGVLAALKRVPGEFSADSLLRQAAATAFYLTLALVPGAVAAFSLFGLVASPETVSSTLDSIATLPGGVADLVLQPARDATTAETGSLGVGLVVGVLAALWTASAGTKSLMEAIGVAYDEPEGRGFLALRGTALALTVLVVAVLGGAVVVLTVADGVAVAAGLPSWVGQVLRFPVLLVGIAVLLAALYRYGPDRADARWSWVSPGALVAAVLWLLVTGAFTVYVDTFGSYDETYGSLAGAVVLLLWLQLSAAAWLFGAEVNAELERQTLTDTTTGPARPMGERGAVAADYPPGVEPIGGEDGEVLDVARVPQRAS